MLDVIVLGDGYTTAASFRAALADWLAAFYTIRAYEVFAGCLRVRALYTPSAEPASSRRDSFYRCKLATDGRSLEKDDWWTAGDADGIGFRAALWAGVDTFADANPRRYPLDLDVGASNQAITNDRLRDLYRNLVVVMLVSSAATGHPSGFTGDVSRPRRTAAGTSGWRSEPTRSTSSATASGCSGRVHQRARDRERGAREPAPQERVLALEPELFRPRGRAAVAAPVPGRPRAAQRGRPGSLAAGGLAVGRRQCAPRRLALGVPLPDERQPRQLRVHPERGRRSDRERRRHLHRRDRRRAARRDRFCLWCQELVTLRILERTDQLLQAGDPDDVSAQGELWYTRWVERLRTNYWSLFDVPGQIADAEARYAALAPGTGGEPLWRSDLYSVPAAAPAVAAAAAPPADDELFLLTCF